MRELSIGAVARASGLAASALRYYERAGLLPAPPRRSGQRRYGEHVFGRIALIRLALEAGFTVSETRLFVSGFSPDTPPAARWRLLAARKLVELKAQMQRAVQTLLGLESLPHPSHVADALGLAMTGLARITGRLPAGRAPRRQAVR